MDGQTGNIIMPVVAKTSAELKKVRFIHF